MGKVFETRNADALAADEQSWKCKTCDTMIEDVGKTHCSVCAQYWADVESGLFDDDY